MSLDYCSICKIYSKKYCSYPASICRKCCPNIPVKTILSILDITYHEAISWTNIQKINSQSFKLDEFGPYFWCTTDINNLYQRCGVGQDIEIRTNPTETEIVIIKAYWSDDTGLRDMKKLKQNFKRIRAGEKFARY